MDQEIEADAREFLAFLEQCSQQPRAFATSNLTSWLKSLHSFLERIQSVIDPTAHGSIPEETMMTTPIVSELYPTLGVLLNQLCRNPVVLASEAIADLVAQSVFKYSKQTDHFPDYNQSLRRDMSPERMWCANRLKEMLRKQNIQDASSGKKGFSELFGIPEADIRQQRVVQTIEVLCQYMYRLFSMVATKPLTPASRRFMIAWNHQLSGLSAPLVSYPAASLLIEGVIDLAYSLKTGTNCTQPISPSTTFLDPAFVEQVLLCSRDEKKRNKILSEDSQILRFCEVSSLARQRYLMDLTDKVMTASAKQAGFALSREEVFHKFIEPSRLIPALARSLKETIGEQNDLMHSTLEDIAVMTGEIADWRFVRICVLLIEWLLAWRGNRKLDNYSCMPESENMSETAFEAMILSSCSILQLDIHGSSAKLTSSKSLELLMTAQKNYIHCFAGPDRFILRRRLAFLVSAAIAQHSEFLIHQICFYFDSLKEKPQRQGQDKEFMADKQLVAFMVDLILANDSEQLNSSILSEQLTGLLQELQTVCSVDNGRNSTPNLTMESIESIIVKYKSILRMNETLLADIICAIG
ncbi:hypothetical protein BGX27_000768, partial [Mortierella sp. AM989]